MKIPKNYGSLKYFPFKKENFYFFEKNKIELNISYIRILQIINIQNLRY